MDSYWTANHYGMDWGLEGAPKTTCDLCVCVSVCVCVCVCVCMCVCVTLGKYLANGDTVDCSLPGSFVHEIFQARIPSPGALPNLGVKPGSLALQVDSLPSEPLGKPRDNILISNPYNSYVKGQGSAFITYVLYLCWYSALSGYQ